MRTILALVLALLTACSGCASFPRPVGDNLPPRYANPMHSTVRVEIWCDLNGPGMGKLPIGLGSGVAIRANEIVTAAHVANITTAQCPGLEFHIVRWDGKVFLGSPVVVEPDGYDIARIETPPVFEAAPVGREPNVGDEVCGYGWDAPDGFDGHTLQYIERPPFKCGTVTSVTDGIIMSGFHAVHGNSGSGFWNSAGEVIGVVSQAEPDPSKDFWVRGPSLYPRMRGLALGLE